MVVVAQSTVTLSVNFFSFQVWLLICKMKSVLPDVIFNVLCLSMAADVMHLYQNSINIHLPKKFKG